MKDVAKLLMAGAVGIIPTDTVYGIVARATNHEAVTRLYSLKKGRNRPGTVIATSIEQLVDLGLKKRYLNAVKDIWPAAVSVIIPCDDKLSYLHLGTYGLAVRIPSKEDVAKLLKETGPLLTTSANKTGEPTAINISQAKAYFGDLVDFYVDGGKVTSLPSTIIRVVDDEVDIIRQGDISLK